MPTVRLTDLSVKALKPSEKYVTYWSDTTPGFGIRVGKRSRTWTVMRGRVRERVSIGRYPDLSLSDARKEALRLLSEEPSGPRPILKTFKEARAEFLAEHYRGVISRWPHLVKLILEKHFKSFEYKQLGEVTDEDIGQALGRLAATPSQQLHAYRAVRTFLAWCTRPPRRYPPHGKKPLVYPTASDLPPDALVETYLAGTPFRDLFMAPVPLKLTQEDRFSHMHVVGGSGSGKTTLIENLIRHDLSAADPPSIVLIDPHSDLVRRLIRSDLGIEERVVLIDPRDTEHALALNPFAVNRERLAGYDAATREQATAGVIQTFGYLWSGLTNLSLTGKQEVLFRYVTRLMLSLPEVEGRNATILDMLRLMRDPAPYAAAIERLPEIPRGFFLHDFASKSFEGTREQIRYRLQAIIENPTMARLFTAPETKLDFFTEMNRGGVILVDTAKDFLKEGSSIFGKLIISLVLQAVLERAAIREAERKPTFIMVDEAGSFFSTNIDDLLTEARKYKAGLLLAHQYLDQASFSLRASLAANSAIKFASGLSAQDAAAMARDMRTTADFILAQPKLQFAAHIRNVTPSAVSIPLSPVTCPLQLSEERYVRLIARNRERVAVAAEEPEERHSPPSGDEDLSPEW